MQTELSRLPKLILLGQTPQTIPARCKGKVPTLRLLSACRRTTQRLTRPEDAHNSKARFPGNTQATPDLHQETSVHGASAILLHMSHTKKPGRANIYIKAEAIPTSAETALEARGLRTEVSQEDVSDVGGGQRLMPRNAPALQPKFQRGRIKTLATPRELSH